MRDMELLKVLSLISLANSWKIPSYIGGDWNGHIGNDHGVDDVRIGQFTSITPTIPRGVVFARTFVNADLFLADSFYPMIRRGKWRHNNGNWEKLESSSLSDKDQKRTRLVLGSCGEAVQHRRSLRSNEQPRQEQTEKTSK